MIRLAEGQKTLIENMKREGGELFLNDHEVVSSVPYLSVFNQQQRPLLSGSPLSRVSMQSSSEYSPSSSSFSNGFCSSEDGSPLCAEASYQAPRGSYYFNGLCCLDSKSPYHHDCYNTNNGKMLVDELGLSQCLYKMSIKEERNGGGGGAKMKGLEVDADGFGFGFGGGDCSLGGSVQYGLQRNGSCGGSFNNGGFDIESFQSSPRGVSLCSEDGMKCAFSGLQGGFDKGVADIMGSFYAHNPSNDSFSGSGWWKNQRDFLLENRKEQGRSRWSNRNIQLQDTSTTTRPYLNEDLVGYQRYKMDSNEAMGVMEALSPPQFRHATSNLHGYDPLYKSFILKERTRAITNNGVPQSLLSVEGAGDLEGFSSEDGIILQGKGLNPVSNKGCHPLKGQRKNSLEEISVQNQHDSCTFNGGICQNGQRLSSYSSLPVAPTTSSLAEVQGYITLMAQDQNGCRFLQRIFEEGTNRDVEIIFNEIVEHVVELTLLPFGNYVIQKLLDVCNEEQRLQIVLMVTKEPGQLMRICLNTYGTRVVQKLIDTLKSRRQISLVVLALKPGFLNLIKDQNGNHVIQRCLQCLSNEDNKFIFDGATKFCVEIATHRHGCCVMQRCIAHSTGKQRDKLINEISKNGLLLTQDPFGNYVVQYIIELKSPSTMSNLLSQFKGHYIQLSMQKFSSHVVEKCLKHFEESRSQIVHELLSVSHFEQLLQDPYANYVIQSALAVTKGPLHSSLVEAVRPHMILRTSPYCKRIFSRNLLKK